MAITNANLFDTYTLTKAVEMWKTPSSALLDFFFKQEKLSPDKYIEYDILEESNTLAPLVDPNAQATPVDKMGYTKKVVQPCYTKMKSNISSIDALSRQPGEGFQITGSPMQRAIQQLNRELKQLQNKVIRREEWLASQALQLGVTTLDGDYTGTVHTWGQPSGHRYTVTTKWDNTASDPVDDLSAIIEIIVSASGYVPDTVIMGLSATNAFLKNETILQQLDKIRLRIGEVNISNVQQGLSYIGQFSLPNAMINMYSYTERYLDSTGTEQKMLDPKKVIVGSSMAGDENLRAYGAIQNIKYDEGMPKRWFVDSWVSDDPAQRFLSIESSPMAILRVPKAFGCIQVLA